MGLNYQKPTIKPLSTNLTGGQTHSDNSSAFTDELFGCV